MWMQFKERAEDRIRKYKEKAWQSTNKGTEAKSAASLADPHHLYAVTNPVFHFDADLIRFFTLTHIRIWLYTFMRIQIWLYTFMRIRTWLFTLMRIRNLLPP
jgi:hypothetical protein